MSKGNGQIPATMSEAQLLARDDVQQLLANATVATREQDAAYFLHAYMLAVENLTGQDKLATARTLDDAVTGLLADFKAHLSPEHAAGAAVLLIHNIALFLDEARRDRVLAALEVDHAS